MLSARSSAVLFLAGVLALLGLHDGGHPLRAQEMPIQASRTWTDHSGRVQVEAAFLGFKDGKVELQQNDGKVLRIAIENLSDVDWEFVRQQVRISQADREPRPSTTAVQKRPIIHEDFSRFEKGDLPDWGEGVHVEVGQDGRKWLVASKGGRHQVGQRVVFPREFWYLEFDFTAQVRKEPRDYRDKGFVTTSISVVDDQKRAYRIAWRMDPRRHTFVLPDGTTHDIAVGTSVPAEGKKKEDAEFWLRGRTLRIEKRGNELRLSVDGEAAFSGNIDTGSFSDFVRFAVDVYKSDWGNEFIYFTNFKVGSL